MKVHYGIGTVREGPYGVDLSAFRQVTLVHPDGENARIGDVVYWLTGSFSLDPEVWSVTVQGLWSRSATEIQWELRSLMRTVSWKGFLEGCRRRGYECVLLVQPCPKEDVAGPSDSFSASATSVCHGHSVGVEKPDAHGCMEGISGRLQAPWIRVRATCATMSEGSRRRPFRRLSSGWWEQLVATAPAAFEKSLP